jgi:arginine repressor
MGQHFRKAHRDHPRVAQILNIEDQKTRRQMFNALVGEGRERHNALVVEDKEGIYAVKYRKESGDYTYGALPKKYKKCEGCHQMLKSKERHVCKVMKSRYNFLILAKLVYLPLCINYVAIFRFT